MPGTEPRPQRWEVRVLPLCHHGPPFITEGTNLGSIIFTHLYHLLLLSTEKLKVLIISFLKQHPPELLYYSILLISQTKS